MEEFSGEDRELVRRLVFLSNPMLAQTEVQMVEESKISVRGEEGGGYEYCKDQIPYTHFTAAINFVQYPRRLITSFSSPACNVR